MTDLTEMEIRVAKAICRAQCQGFEADGLDVDESVNEWWSGYVTEARAAIRAMRDPTKDMLDAGVSVATAAGGWPPVVRDPYEAEKTRAMRDRLDSYVKSATTRTQPPVA